MTSINYLAEIKESQSQTAVDLSASCLSVGAVPITFQGAVAQIDTNGQPTFQSGTAPPAAGNLTAGILVSSTASLGIFFGDGAPTIHAAKGSLYLNTTGSSTSTRAYIATDAVGTWTAITTAA